MTLIELLVVISMIALLISLLIPSLKRSVKLASATICQHHLKQIGTCLQMYTMENNGWLPVTRVEESSVASAVPQGSAWFSMLHPTYMNDAMVLRCPSDPFGDRLQYYRDRIDDPEAANAVSYGLNQFIMTAGGGYLADTDRREPQRPNQTILAADLGPDDMRFESRIREVEGPGRNDSLMAWGGGWDPYTEETKSTWLTRRHGHGIHMLAMDYSVHQVGSDAILRSPVKRTYPACKSGGCALCTLRTPHYSFAKDHLFWWTGGIPSE
jgi:type II secretory pathway pseudopilin PulG